MKTLMLGHSEFEVKVPNCAVLEHGKLSFGLHIEVTHGALYISAEETKVTFASIIIDNYEQGDFDDSEMSVLVRHRSLITSEYVQRFIDSFLFLTGSKSVYS